MGSKFVWYDVTARRPDVVREFYAALFEWQIGPDPNPGPYNGWIMDGERPWAAVVEADDATAGRWLPYVQVDDLDVAVAKAIGLGGTVIQDKTDGPAGTAVTIVDPGGALVALWVPFPGA